MRIHHKFLALAIIGAVFLGAGCWDKGNAPAAAKPETKPTTAAKPTPPKDPDTELKEILAAFHESKSYKTKFRLPTKDGIVKGTLDHTKPNRYQGMTQLGSENTAEIVIVGKELYMKIGDLTWEDMSDTKAGKAIIENMTNAAQGNSAFNQEQTDKLKVLTRQTDELNGCKLFIARSTDAKPESPPVKICAKNGLPQYFEIDTNLGVYHVDFYDFNSIFIIERPM